MNEINIEELREMCRENKIKWTVHMLQRLEERELTREDVINCIMQGKIIEQYPSAFPFASCLILGATVTDEHIHVVAAVGGLKVHVMTAYLPSAEKWEDDMTTRKRR